MATRPFDSIRRLLNKPMFGTRVIPTDARIDPECFPEDEFPVYCTGCDYELRGLPEPRCPECGQGFDRGTLLVEPYVRTRGLARWKQGRRWRVANWFGIVAISAQALNLAYVWLVLRFWNRSPSSLPTPGEVDFGIWAFFRQLWRYFDGKEWKPPTHPDHRRSKLWHSYSKALRLLERKSPKFCPPEALESAAGWSGNGATIARRIRKAGFGIESAREARKTDPAVPKDAKGYRLKHY